MCVFHQSIQRILIRLGLACFILILPALGCTRANRTLEVTATAYNSLPAQTQGNPNLTAWGDTLAPGMKAIAVSRDLLAMGFSRGVKVTIEGLPGTYVVMDKLNKRWKMRIDIYMGIDKKAAKQWGKRQVKISW